MIPARQSWFSTALIVGVVYAVIGIVFAAPSSHVRIWRLAAWALSGVVFATHIAYEHFKLKNFPLVGALHTTLAVAVGAFGLALAANIRNLWFASGYRPLLAVALVAWPILTGVPAFVVALITTYVLAVITRRTQATSSS